MESGLAASKKGFLKKQCPFTGCRAGDAGGGFYSMPSEGPAGTKRHFQSLRTPRLCRGTWLKKAAGCAPQKASASRAGQSRLRAAPLRNKSSAAGTALSSPVFGPQAG